MKRRQTVSRGASAADHALRSGDRSSGGSSVDLSQGS
jgi:type IV secretion system protein TrbL